MALILVVDDEFGVAEVLDAILGDVGHEVVTAANGREALDRLKERPPDLVLLDFMMPVMDGPSVLKAMREAPTLRNIPTVIMSSLPESTVSKSVGSGYAAFLRKPFKLNAVVDAVNAALGPR